MIYLTKQLSNREDVYEIATGGRHVDLIELIRIEASIIGIPLHNLPDSLVTPTMVLSATVRQFRENVEFAIRKHREMDSAAFENFFRILREMNESLELTWSDIATEVDRKKKKK